VATTVEERGGDGIQLPHAAVVFNPAKFSAGAMTELRDDIRREEQGRGWDATTWHETSEDDDERAAREAADSHPALVVVAGGDGTVRAVAERLAGNDIPLGVVPAGSGNLLARNLGLPVNDRTEAVRVAFGGADRRIDLASAELADAGGDVTRSHFLVMAGIGLDARMASDTNSAVKRRVGWLAYTDPILRSVFSGDRFSISYSVDGGRTNTMRAHTIIVGNCGTLTAGILLIPGAEPDDGLLDIVALNPAGFGGWLGVGVRLALNRLLHRSRGGRLVLPFAPDVSAIRYGQARTMLARFNRPQAIELDGDSFGDVVRVRIRVQPAALLVRVPHEEA
jgi:diacylglycerol kinase family enzyme